jgi:hypothetical protein
MLYGFEVAERSVSGQAQRVTLVWQALKDTGHDYKVFVHLLNSEGQLVAQSDAVPANWTRPTNDWQIGEFVTDTHTLDLGPDLPPGLYRLRAGMYDYGGRLQVAGGGDSVELGNIQILAK